PGRGSRTNARPRAPGPCAIAPVYSSSRAMLEHEFLECRRRLEEKDEHGAALGCRRRVAAPLGADDEIAGGAFALVIEQRAFDYEGLLQILVDVCRNTGAWIEPCWNGQHAGGAIVINDLHLVARTGLDPRYRLGLDEARCKRRQ